MKVLVCDNEFSGWENARSNPEQYVGRPLESLAKYHADFFGLASWFERADDVDFKSYDLIWIYLGHRSMQPAWYCYPRLIRQKAPNAKIVFNVDYEGFWHEKALDLRFKESFECADVMHVITRWGEEYFKKRLSIPVYYGHLGRPHSGGIKAPDWIPFPKRKRKSICFIRHTNVPSILTEMEIIKKMNAYSIGIDSIPPPFSDGRYLSYLARIYNIKGDFYPRLPFPDYLRIIGQCSIALCNHVGISRFAWECAVCGVPVVHSDLSEWGNNLFPSLTVPHGNISKFCEMIETFKRKKHEYKYSILESAKKLMDTQYGFDMCQNRLDELINGVMKNEFAR